MFISSASSAALTVVALVVSCTLRECSCADVQPTVLNMIHARGSHYEVGFQVGNGTRPMIERRLAYTDVQDYIIPFLGTAAGQEFMQVVMNATTAYHPWFVEEMRGIADGANVSFESIFILNALAELQQYTNASVFDDGRTSGARPRHCTDVMSTPTTTSVVWGHNEDGSEGDRETCFFVNVTVISDDGVTVEERFVAFGYAGTVAGLAYGWNMHGVVFTLNSLSPNIMAVQNPMSQAVGRDAYRATSVDDAVDRLARGRGISGYNMNIASIHEPKRRIVSVEMDSFGKAVSVHETSFTPAATPFNPTPPSYFYHVNTYLVLNTPEPADPTSTGRLNVLATYPQPTTLGDVQQMLGDTSNSSYPVYNGNGTVDDPVQTLTTVVYDFANEVAHIFNTNPRQPAARVFSLRYV